MAKIKPARRLLTEDFPKEYLELVGKLAFVLNPFFDSTISTLSNNLTIDDNFNGQELEISIKTPITSANPLAVLHRIKGNVRGTIITRVDNLDNINAVLSATPFIEFTNTTSNQILIKNITGLAANTRYNLRVILLG